MDFYRRQMIRRFAMFSLMLILTTVVLACGGLQEQKVINPDTGRVMEMDAFSYSFEPNNLKTYKGDIVTLAVENTSGSEHNITILNPAGEEIINVDLPAGKTVNIKVEFTEKGEYPFFCDKPFHKTLGMTGRFMIVERQQK